jgi:hypothetical protein
MEDVELCLIVRNSLQFLLTALPGNFQAWQDRPARKLLTFLRESHLNDKDARRLYSMNATEMRDVLFERLIQSLKFV